MKAGFARSAHPLYALRCALGVAEAGFAPSLLFYLAGRHATLALSTGFSARLLDGLVGELLTTNGSFVH